MNIKAVKTYLEKLQNLGLLINHHLGNDVLNLKVDCISYDSRTLFGNSIFICKGNNFKPEYLSEAIEKGAIAYISEEKIEDFDNFILVKDIRSAIKHLSAFHFDNPSKKIKTIGITGTKGKSTVAYMLKSVLDLYLQKNNKPPSGLISTIETFDGKNNFDSKMTTPEPIELQQLFYTSVQNGLEYLIMEVSSQALKYERTHGVTFDVACFTNFGKDHISNIEHSNLQDYFDSKMKIFNNCKVACINHDTEKYEEVFKYAYKYCEVITYGKDNDCSIVYSNVKCDDFGCSFNIKSDKYNDDFYIGVPGNFNVENALATISICYALDIPIDYIKEGLRSVRIPGRMKIVTSKDKKAKIIVDFAHNEMSFEALYKSVTNQYSTSKIVGIFGCPGDKAQHRRIELPKIASKYCDSIIICEDDPGNELFKDIANDMIKNVDIKNVKVIESREEALIDAIENVNNEDTIIVFTGKGEEAYIKRGNNYEECESDLRLANRIISLYDMKIGK